MLALKAQRMPAEGGVWGPIITHHLFPIHLQLRGLGTGALGSPCPRFEVTSPQNVPPAVLQPLPQRFVCCISHPDPLLKDAFFLHVSVPELHSHAGSCSTVENAVRCVVVRWGVKPSHRPRQQSCGVLLFLGLRSLILALLLHFGVQFL